MKTTKPTKEEQKQAALEHQRANEKIHNLVIKIISWRAGILDGALIEESNKITQKEWDSYRRHILKISKVAGSDQVKSKLHETQEAIRRNGGFEF